MCHNAFFPLQRQFYCGNWRFKKGCAYERWKENKRKMTRKLYPESYRRLIKGRPWYKNWASTKQSAKIKTREHTLTLEDVKNLWFRDEAFLMKQPSIDRIDGTKGYIEGNCRFMEKSENSRIGNLGTKRNVQEKIILSRALGGEPIAQYDLDGNLLKIWNYHEEIRRTLKIHGIPRIFKGKQKTAGGFIWKKHV